MVASLNTKDEVDYSNDIFANPLRDPSIDGYKETMIDDSISTKDFTTRCLKFLSILVIVIVYMAGFLTGILYRL